MSDRYDVLIIGAGPGGYVAAVDAAKRGLKTAIVDKDALGGVCLNWGCIPSKNLIHQAVGFRALTEMEQVGVRIDRDSLNYGAVQSRSRQVVKTLTGGVASLLKRHGVEWIAGSAILKGPREVLLDDGTILAANAIVLATGSRPMEVPEFEFDETMVLSSNGILAMQTLPKSLIILGGGAIGCEFAYVMCAFGVDVTLVEALDQLLPTEDADCAQALAASFQHSGIEVLIGTRASSLVRNDSSVSVSLIDSAGASIEREAERVLVVFGRTPNTNDLGLDTVGVKTDEKGHIVVGKHQETTVPGIYAVGDLTRTAALAHVASKEGEIAIAHISGDTGTAALDESTIPSAIYCEPQVAGFGIREAQAKAQNLNYKATSFAYPGAGKSIAVGKPDGFVKVLTDKDSGELLGAHIFGYNATELIHELMLARHSELLPEDIGSMVHAHPTFSETVMEVMRGVDGKAIHG